MPVSSCTVGYVSQVPVVTLPGKKGQPHAAEADLQHGSISSIADKRISQPHRITVKDAAFRHTECLMTNPANIRTVVWGPAVSRRIARISCSFRQQA